ncbi:response regulator transcription factor [Micropruina sp.]|uniref:response regulator transcription factor n=1 Tax=Micropruina sp. TaxID=2737536 RepID=UPI0039E57DF1
MTDTAPIRVLIVDDQPLQRTGHALILGSADDIEVIDEADNGEQAISLVRVHHPDVVLMDVRMPGIGGIEATRAITRDAPGTRVVVLTTFDLDEYAFGSLRAGASAFLLKTTKPDALIDAVRTVHSGTAVVDPRLTQQLIEHFLDSDESASGDASPELASLTRRERDIFDAIAHGFNNTEISQQLCLAPSTMKSYINTIYAKLGLRDRVHAVLLAHSLGKRPRR